MTTLVIDIGSSSTRAILFDDGFRQIEGSMSQKTHRFHTTPDGAATANPIELRQMTESCITQTLQHGAADNIRRVGMTTFVGNMLGTDDQNNPLTPLYTYADSRSNGVLDNQSLNTSVIRQRTGAPPHSAYRPAQLSWLKKTQKAMFKSVNTWTDFATYCYSYWFDVPVPCSYSIASWSGLLHREDLTWDAEWLQLLGLDKTNFPSLADYNAVQQGLSTEYAARWPQLTDIPFFLAIGDGAASNIGSGAVTEKTVALTVGTTAAVRTITPAPPTVPDGLWSYRVTAKHHLTGGATTEGGGTYEWLRARLKFSPSEMEGQLQYRQPGQHGLQIIPLLDGERSPGWEAGATGTIHGLRSSTTDADIVHATLESIALRLSVIADAVAPNTTTVKASGGALIASPVWAQWIADALDRQLILLDTGESTARGIAVLINNGVSEVTIGKEHKFSPKPENTAALKALRRDHLAFYHKIYNR